jgi:hypothetical protein
MIPLIILFITIYAPVWSGNDNGFTRIILTSGTIINSLLKNLVPP